MKSPGEEVALNTAIERAYNQGVADGKAKGYGQALRERPAQVFVIQGILWAVNCSGELYRYDPNTNDWRTMAPIPNSKGITE